MKKGLFNILGFLLLCLAPIWLQAQTTIRANKAEIKNEIKVAGKAVKGISNATTIGTGSADSLITQKAVKDYVTASVTEGNVALAAAKPSPITTKTANVVIDTVGTDTMYVWNASRYMRFEAGSGGGGAPSGPAGGDLDGTYPDPGIGDDKIISAYVLNGTLVNDDLANHTLDSNKVKQRALPLEKLAQSGASNGEVPKFNSTTGTWEPGTDNSGGTSLINIVNEGAVGDGTTDNLSVIQTALNTYGMVYVPPGNFKISGTLVIPTGGKILGSGYNSIISASVGDTLVRMRLNSTIEGVRLDGTDAAGQVGVYWKGLAVVGVTVAGCYITDMIAGIRVDSVGYGPQLSSTIRDCQIRSCATGIYIGQRAEYIQIINNICEQNTMGMYIRGGNNSVTGGSTGYNSIGLSVDGGSNNAHTAITGLSSNHNTTKSVEIDSVSLGLLITGCSFFAAPNLTINESNSIQFVNNNVECTTDHAVTNSTEIIYTNNIWWNATSDPTLNAGSKASLIGNRTKGTQAVTTISAPNTSGAFPLNIEIPSTGNRGLNITREGVSASAGFMGLWTQTTTPGIFAPFWYAKSSTNALPHLAFIALNDAGGDTGSQPSISFQAADGYINLNRPLFSFDAQTSNIAMRMNVGSNLTLGWQSTRQDSVRLAVKGRSKSATSYSGRFYDSDNNPLLSVANNGVVTITSTLWRNSAQNVGDFIGTGSPEGVVTAHPGSTFSNSDGTNPPFCIKRTGTGNTNWDVAFAGLKGSATLDFDDTAAGAVNDKTITVTGAVDGDVVSLGIPNAAQTTTGSFFAWVSATNTVTVRFTPGVLTGTENPNSGVFKVTVTK